MFEKGFPQDKLITYSGMLWLLAAQIVVMLPLIFYLPIWLLPILIFSAVWRIRVMQGHNAQPGNFIKIIIGLLGLGALAASGIKIVSLDMMASLLMLGFAYKALEVIQRRDGMVVILTGFVLIGVLFLYNQSMLIALYGVLSMTVLTGALIAIQQSKSYAILPNLRLSSMMLLLCLPLMLLFFFFAPRFEPFWKVPQTSGHAKTGISDSMTPGDIAELSQSDDLAFSVKFEGKRPGQNELYWRGLVLQHFDGKTWTQSDIPNGKGIKIGNDRLSEKQVAESIVKRGDSVEYEVIYEKSGQPWLFALTPVLEVKGRAFLGGDFRIISYRDINEPKLLKLTSYPKSLRGVELSDYDRDLALQLPDGGNQKSRLLADRLMASSASKQEYINRVLDRFRQDQYFYTLRPPTLGSENSIDDFLIDSKRGFCAHYAGSFVFMMRAAGIPARVVTGYQGGKWNEQGQFLAVHQFDAHAWTEVWLEGQGWVRFDPTAMVAPSRIEQNLETAMESEGSFLEDNFLSMSKIKWLDGIREKIDSAQYAWRRHVLGYDKNAQQNFLKKMFGELSVQKIGLIVGGLFAGIILLWVMFLGLARKRETEAEEHQLYRRFCDLMAKKGVTRDISQTPETFRRFAMQELPDLAGEINRFTQAYSSVCYDPSIQSKHQSYIDDMKSLLKKLNR
ncbi:DUF3488 and transglutaminase-like domain-containing protein [Cocleimonas sp. KMM 6892]|uniref:transglutaminase TgpA family protein n=1 Tax=unclassified Cocleimonas TaxID=2639732 RepID=UPI002DB8C0D4|nr:MULTISPECIES: DUF3488 and transglutaminase-like domain-containing protein [unclassified Cocleimonas]MEB8433658.1 DUF3488 and transglutaminase-like domain-containing protein [Cocleimonas sp. KMM 6892]MEC4716469.1 DUF3488 and transglutaminase-like domain-containing protein [Cocleimonas sp. KMM 6895]MEC4745638.1 DUF3488 and transglutaminase-like domain-containing protein [Cocleimonas sp. KMM 6896]